MAIDIKVYSLPILDKAWEHEPPTSHGLQLHPLVILLKPPHWPQTLYSMRTKDELNAAICHSHKTEITPTEGAYAALVST